MNAEEIKSKIAALQKEIDSSLFEDDELCEKLYKKRKRLEFKLFQTECGGENG